MNGDSFWVSWIENGMSGKAQLGFISSGFSTLDSARKELERIREWDRVVCAWIDRFGPDNKKSDTPVMESYINYIGDREMWRFQKPNPTTYKDRFYKVAESGKYEGKKAKVEALAQLIYANDRSRDKEDCLVQALEEYELMTGSYWDPTHAEYNAVLASII